MSRLPGTGAAAAATREGGGLRLSGRGAAATRGIDGDRPIP